MKTKEKEVDSEAVVHHIHHNAENDGYRREVNINGSIYNVSLCSNDPEENMEYLSKKALDILKQIKHEVQ